MGYSTKAGLLAAVESLGDASGLTTMEDMLMNWRFTEKCTLTAHLRDIPSERVMLSSHSNKIRKVVVGV